MRRHHVAAAALALSATAAPAAAQTFHVVSLEPRALTDDDVPRLTALLGTWAEMVRPEAAGMWDPLAAARGASAHVVVPPQAAYDRACSALVGEAVFTLGAEPSPGEMAELTDVMMRAGALMAREAPDERPAAPAGAPSLLSLAEGALAGKGMGELLAGGENAATVREGMRAQQGVTSGPSLRLTGRIDDWYVARGFTYDGWETHEGDERDGSLLVWGGDDDDIQVELDAFNERAALWPTCAHLPRGPIVRITTTGGDVDDAVAELEGRMRSMRLARLGEGGDEDALARRFQRALDEVGIEGSEFMQLLVSTTDAAWLADNPAIREAIVKAAGRDPANPVARSMMRHAENARWFERHRSVLEPALAGWRAAFEAGR